MRYQTPQEIFENSFQANCGGAVKGDSRMNLDGAYDAVGNLVNAGDQVLRIKGHRKGQIQTVAGIEIAGYTGTQNILASDDSWPRMYNIIKI